MCIPAGASALAPAVDAAPPPPDACMHAGVHLLPQEIRRIWVGYWSQCDAMLGQKIAAKLQSAGGL